MAGEGRGRWGGRAGSVSLEGVDVADDGLVAFVDAEGVAADAAAVERDEAGEDAAVEVFEEKLGGAACSPSGGGAARRRLRRSSSGRSCAAEKWRRSRISSCWGTSWVPEPVSVERVEIAELGGNGSLFESRWRMGAVSLMATHGKADDGAMSVGWSGGVDLVDGEALGVVEEERLVDAAGEVAGRAVGWSLAGMTRMCSSAGTPSVS